MLLKKKRFENVNENQRSEKNSVKVGGKFAIIFLSQMRLNNVRQLDES